MSQFFLFSLRFSSEPLCRSKSFSKSGAARKPEINISNVKSSLFVELQAILNWKFISIYESLPVFAELNWRNVIPEFQPESIIKSNAHSRALFQN